MQSRSRQQRMPGRLTAAIMTALITSVLTAGQVTAAVPTESSGDGVDTVLVFEQPVGITELTAAVEASGLQLVSLWYDAPGEAWGQFNAGGDRTGLLSVFASIYAEEFGTAESAQIFGARFIGKAAFMLAFAPAAAESLLVAPSAVVSVTPVRGTHPAIVLISTGGEETSSSEPSYVEGESGDEYSETEVMAAGTGHWWPQTGKVIASNTGDSSLPVAIKQEIRWDSTAGGDPGAFGPTYAYEHNFRLYSAKSSLGTRPACINDGDFWATRNKEMWSWSLPVASRPYVDTNSGDPCTTMDITLGIFEPTKLAADITFWTKVRASGNPSRSNVFSLIASKDPKDCNVAWTWCVNVNGADSRNPVPKTIISKSAGKKAPGTHGWSTVVA